MDKEALHLGLYRGLAPFVSEKEALDQWNRGPKQAGPSIALKLVQRGKATKTEPPSESSPED